MPCCVAPRATSPPPGPHIIPCGAATLPLRKVNDSIRSSYSSGSKFGSCAVNCAFTASLPSPRGTTRGCLTEPVQLVHSVFSNFGFELLYSLASSSKLRVKSAAIQEVGVCAR